MATAGPASSTPAKRIALASYFFPPENTPRAFRAAELAKGFAKAGHDVTVYAPDYRHDYAPFERRYGLTVRPVKTGFLLNRDAKADFGEPAPSASADRTPDEGKPVRIPKALLPAVQFLYRLVYFDGLQSEYAWRLSRALIRDGREFDAIVSIALPFAVHAGTSLALRARPSLAKVRIADYGDPYSTSPSRFRMWYEPMLERLVLRDFDHVTVPTDKAVPYCTPFKPRRRVHVIPNGLDFAEVRRADYRPNDVPTFAYAGKFYAKLRNPRFLFEFLAGLDRDFRFVLYVAQSRSEQVLHRELGDMLTHYREVLGEKLEIHPPVPRLECIRALSRMDFLVNIGNLSTTQTPSKLVDYALTGRPIYSTNEQAFDPKVLLEFMDGNYRRAWDVDLDAFRIENVCRAFMDMIARPESR